LRLTNLYRYQAADEARRIAPNIAKLPGKMQR
jgi:hypothetical protein